MVTLLSILLVMFLIGMVTSIVKTITYDTLFQRVISLISASINSIIVYFIALAIFKHWSL